MSIRILTTILSEQEVGSYYLLMTILALLSFVFYNPFGQYYGRRLIKWQQNNNALNATNVIIFLRVCASVVALLVAFFLYLFLDYQKYFTLTVFLCFVFISLLAGVHGVLLNAVNILGDRIKFIIIAVFTLIVGLVLSIIIVNYIDQTAIGWLYGVAISQIIFSIYLYKEVVKNNSFSFVLVKSIFSLEYIEKMALFAIPVAATLFLQWGQNQSYRFIIDAKYSVELLAYIGVGLAVSGAIFSAIESLATQFYNPIYFRRITNASKAERANAWNELAGYMMPIYVVLAIYVFSLASHFTNILVASKFYEAYIFAMLGVLIEFFRVISNLVYMVSQSEVKTNTTVAPYAIGFVFMILILYGFDMSANTWLIPFVVGLSNGIIFIFLYINMKKILDININYTNILKAFVYSTPLYVFLLLAERDGFLLSLLMVCLGGLYCLLLVYMIVKRKFLWRVL